MKTWLLLTFTLMLMMSEAWSSYLNRSIIYSYQSRRAENFLSAIMIFAKLRLEYITVKQKLLSCCRMERKLTLMTFFRFFQRLVIEKLYQTCSVVLLNDIDNGGTKSIFPSLFDTLLYVGDNYQGAHAGF